MSEDNIFMKQENSIKKDQKEYGWTNDRNVMKYIMQGYN